jgi:predicted transposase YdaD
MTLAERFDQWAQQYEQRGKLVGWQEGRQEGRLEGEQTGEARLLQRLLTRRFGALSADCVARIRTASSGQLEQWSDRVLDARTLAEVFEQA